jgi:hypothetical protein
MSGPQQLQHQSLGNNKILQVSIGNGIWFGTRGSEVQILSPRPIFSYIYVSKIKIKCRALVLAQGLISESRLNTSVLVNRGETAFSKSSTALTSTKPHIRYGSDQERFWRLFCGQYTEELFGCDLSGNADHSPFRTLSLKKRIPFLRGWIDLDDPTVYL